MSSFKSILMLTNYFKRQKYFSYNFPFKNLFQIVRIKLNETEFWKEVEGGEMHFQQHVTLLKR